MESCRRTDIAISALDRDAVTAVASVEDRRGDRLLLDNSIISLIVNLSISIVVIYEPVVFRSRLVSRRNSRPCICARLRLPVRRLGRGGCRVGRFLSHGVAGVDPGEVDIDGRCEDCYKVR